MAKLTDVNLLFPLESKNYQRKSTGQIFIFFNTDDDPEVRENLGDRRVRVPGSAHRQTFTGKDGLRQRNPRTGSETLYKGTRYAIKCLPQIFLFHKCKRAKDVDYFKDRYKIKERKRTPFFFLISPFLTFVFLNGNITAKVEKEFWKT